MFQDPGTTLRSAMSAPIFSRFFAACLVLSLTVFAVTAHSLKQASQQICEQLAMRGITTLHFLEDRLLSSLPLGPDSPMQRIMESAPLRENILFVAICDDNGSYAAHSSNNLVGSRLSISGTEAPGNSFGSRLLELLPNKDEDGCSWGFIYLDGKKMMLVHRSFAGPATPPRDHDAQKPVPGRPPQHVLVALNTASVGGMITKYRRSAMSAALGIVLGGIVLSLLFTLIQRNIETQKRMKATEDFAAHLVEEVRRLEGEVARKERLTVIGSLTAGVAHEIRNPLSSIKGYAIYFAERFPVGSPEHNSARIMAQEADRLNRTITELLEVSKPTALECTVQPVAPLIENVVTLLAQDAESRHIRFELDLGREECCIDPDRFRQALLNVCLNALEAMSGGVIRISTGIPPENANAFFFIDVEDDGPGIPEELLDRIFDPYFTTKSTGTGLGMVNVAKIIEGHGGKVMISSQLGHGTTVRFLLPKAFPDHSAVVRS
ncbi:MAG: hypothetical protein J5855_00535 [Mailhella sp.]|nr:hypothetical protein [Mailhella sp.]